MSQSTLMRVFENASSRCAYVEPALAQRNKGHNLGPKPEGAQKYFQLRSSHMKETKSRPSTCFDRRSRGGPSCVL